ncbi:MAG: hypothetical protein HDR24_02400 [Lachnospiraceae bacterium]|nr:hypothetical protein [Lachnospiraceae bacterium]
MIDLVLVAYLYASIFLASDRISFLTHTVAGIAFSHMIEAEYQNIQRTERNDLLYRTYPGTCVDLDKEASLIITSTQVDMEDGKVVWLINASNNTSIIKSFIEGMSIDNVASGRYYVYICQGNNGKIVDATPEIKVFYPEH